MELSKWKQKWMTKEVIKAFEKQGDTSEMQAEDIKIIAKFFNAGGVGDWWCFEYDQENEIFWCFAMLDDPDLAEIGTVSLHELASFQGMFGLGIERDRYFGYETTLKEVMDGIKAH